MADSVRMLGYRRPISHETIYVCSSRDDGDGSLSGFRPIVSSIIRSIIVCNTGSDQTDFTIRLIPDSTEDSSSGGISPSDSYNLFDSVVLPAKSTKVISPGIIMSQGKSASLADYLTVQSGNGLSNFYVFGVETT